MKDQDKTEEQIINELTEMRQRGAELETVDTVRKRAEEALRGSEERYRTIFESAPIGIFHSTLEGKIISAKSLMHGKTSIVSNDGRGIFTGVKKPFQAMRYHSLAVERESLPDTLTITAESDDGEIMGVRHKTHAMEGIQFHPESIMTTIGKRLLRNFGNMVFSFSMVIRP